MKRLCEKYRPRSLRDVVGQSATPLLRAFAADPYPACFLLHGPPGCGKTSSAYALAADLGCLNEHGEPDEFGGCWTVIASELLIDTCRELFDRYLRITPMFGSGWKVLVIEELERLGDKVQVYLKVALEKLPRKTVVVATSNGAEGIDRALLQRFRIYTYDADITFASQCYGRLESIWRTETGNVALPDDWRSWGRVGNEFSVRVALDTMQDFLALRKVAV